VWRDAGWMFRLGRVADVLGRAIGLFGEGDVCDGT